MGNDLGETVAAWSAAPDISARSVLVTIFGDSILPITKDVWLSDLFALTEPFGFSQRLVRTSLFRLAAEGWVTNERVGRRSRYALTPSAVSESTDAEIRIYRNDDPTWDGTWTVAIVGSPTVPAAQRDQVSRLLMWHGFVPLGRGVSASINVTPDAARGLLEDAALPIPPIIVGAFADSNASEAAGLFSEVIATTPGLTSAYQEFISFYGRFRHRKLPRLEPLQAFALRTMLIHDFRRVRLRSPNLPPELMPESWIGNDAYCLAADLYRLLSPGAAEALSGTLNLDYPPIFADRFSRCRCAAAG